MDEIKFLRGLQASYDALQEKSSLTFYYCTDTDNLYVGEELLSMKLILKLFLES